tara:strand:+ start:190 stop:2379 length:2190 start_codon:yes stop_codon:yes gene_type:complete
MRHFLQWACASTVSVAVHLAVVLVVLTRDARADGTLLPLRPGVQEARARLARGLPPPCPDDSWVPHTLSQKCYKRFKRHVDFYACQAEVCGPRNATIVTPRTAEVGDFVDDRVVAPHVGADANWTQKSYWIGMYRQPKRRKEWAWVSYGLLEDVTDTRPVPRSFFWAEGEPNDWEEVENCAQHKHLWTDYGILDGVNDNPCSSKLPCVCQFPDVPHPDFELDMLRTKAHELSHEPPAPPDYYPILVYASCACFGLYGLLFCRAAFVVAVGSAAAERRAVRELLYEALTIFPLGLVTGIPAKAKVKAVPAQEQMPSVSHTEQLKVLGEKVPKEQLKVEAAHASQTLVRADTVWLRRSIGVTINVLEDAPSRSDCDQRSRLRRRLDHWLRRLLVVLTTFCFIMFFITNNELMGNSIAVTCALLCWILGCIGNHLLYLTVVKHRTHSVNVMDGVADEKDRRRLTRYGWCTFVILELVAFVAVAVLTHTEAVSSNFGTARVSLFLVTMLFPFPTITASCVVIVGLIAGHAGCIRSLKDLILRHLCSSETSAHDCAETGTSLAKELINLSEVHSQMMDKTKSLVSASVNVTGIALLVGAYVIIRTMVADIMVYGADFLRCLVLVFPALVCAGAIPSLLRAMAKLGDSYRDLVRKMQTIRGQSTGPVAVEVTKLIEYFADEEVMRSHCWLLAGKCITSELVYQTGAGLVVFIVLTVILSGFTSLPASSVGTTASV